LCAGCWESALAAQADEVFQDTWMKIIAGARPI
jgi:hypothetical protein